MYYISSPCTVPSAPRNLKDLVVNTTSIELSWDPPAMFFANELESYYITYGIDQATGMVCII